MAKRGSECAVALLLEQNSLELRHVVQPPPHNIVLVRVAGTIEPRIIDVQRVTVLGIIVPISQSTLVRGGLPKQIKQAECHWS